MPLQSGLKQVLPMNYFTKEEKIRFQHI